MFHKSFRPLFPALPWLLLVLAGAFLLSTPMADPDLWWHLAAGRDLWESGRFPWTDRLCSDTAGRSWTDLHWGFQAILWLFWKAWGPVGAVALRALGLMMAFVVAVRRRKLSMTGAILALWALWIVREAVDLRPLVLSLPLLALQWRLLERWLARPSRSATVALLALQVGLSNVQGLHALGPVCALAFLSEPWDRGATLRARIALLTGLVAASLVTPWPLEGLLLPWHLLQRVLPGVRGSWGLVAENMPLLDFRSTRPLLVWGSLWALLLAAVGGEAKRYRRSWTLLGVAMAGLALSSVRNVPLALLFCAFALARTVPFWMRAGRRRLGRTAWRRGMVGLACVLIAVPLASRWRELRWEIPGRWVAALAFPVSVPQLNDLSRGSLFHPLEWGGWLAFHDAPQLCRGDTRLVLRGQGFLEAHLQLLEDPAAWERWAGAQGIEAALLPVWNSPRYRPLLVHLLSARSDWTLVNLDGSSALFVRGPTSGTVRLEPPPWLRRTEGTTPFLLRASALMETARLLSQTGYPELASRWAREVLP
jgi:hypothetical protein